MVLIHLLNAWNFILQIRGWKGWEQETSTHSYEFTNGINLLAVKPELWIVACSLFICSFGFDSLTMFLTWVLQILQDLDLLMRHLLSERILVSGQGSRSSFTLWGINTMCIHSFVPEGQTSAKVTDCRKLTSCRDASSDNFSSLSVSQTTWLCAMVS